MANAYPSSKRKQVSNITPLAVSVRKTATEMPIPWDEIAPPRVSEWLNVYASANNTSRDILFSHCSLSDGSNEHKSGL